MKYTPLRIILFCSIGFTSLMALFMFGTNEGIGNGLPAENAGLLGLVLVMIAGQPMLDMLHPVFFRLGVKAPHATSLTIQSRLHTIKTQDDVDVATKFGTNTNQDTTLTQNPTKEGYRD